MKFLNENSMSRVLINKLVESENNIDEDLGPAQKVYNKRVLSNKKQVNTNKDNIAELNEEYSSKLGGDPEDFISDVQEILNKLNEIDTTNFGSHLAEEIVEEFIETCNSQISMTKDRFNI